MKELEIIIQPYKIENLKRILDSEGATGVMITQIFGYGREKGQPHQHYTRDEHVGINLMPKKALSLIEMLREKYILSSVCGHYGNILKIRPTLKFSDKDIDWFVTAIDESLCELEK